MGSVGRKSRRSNDLFGGGLSHRLRFPFVRGTFPVQLQRRNGRKNLVETGATYVGFYWFASVGLNQG